MCQETDTAKIAAAHGIDPRAFEDTLHALACFGWHVYAPGNPAIMLIEAAREMIATELTAQRALDGDPALSPARYFVGRANDAAKALIAAARKVAGEGER